jgi:hypothetical protein
VDVGIFRGQQEGRLFFADYSRKIVDGCLETGFQVHGGLPAEFFLGQADIRLALAGVVGGERFEDDLGRRAGKGDDPLGKLKDAGFAGVPQVDRTDEIVGIHEPDEPFNQVGHKAEGAGLGAVAVDGDIFAAQRLDGEVGDHPAVMLSHPRAVGVEDPGEPDIHVVLAVVIHHEGLGHPFPLVIAAPDADGIHVAPVALRLRMYFGVAVDFGGGCLKYPRLHPLCQTQHVDGSHDAGLRGLDRVVLVMDRRGGAGHVVDLVHFQENRFDDVVPDQLEAVVVKEMTNVLLVAGKEVVKADDIVPLGKESFAEMGADEAPPAGNEYAHVLSLDAVIRYS